jgi:hypothetical protein
MRRLVVFVLAAAVAACARAGTTTSSGTVAPDVADAVPDDTYGTLRVDNQNFLDMTIYVIESSGARSRIGTATGNTVTTLRIPNRLLGGARTVRFQADPIGGRETPVSQEVTVIPGEVVVLTIPPR